MDQYPSSESNLTDCSVFKLILSRMICSKEELGLDPVLFDVVIPDLMLKFLSRLTRFFCFFF